MEASTLPHSSAAAAGLRGPTPLFRLASDEKLVALTRRGHHGAFEALVGRYQARLLAFCRHMLGSREDAEDVLQEVFAAAFNAMLADDRPINARPWLYRIARNRSLNHLRRAQAVGVDSMDVHVADHGTTTADKVHRREEFRLLMADVQTLAETQRTALLLREIDALSYEQIAEAMETTVPSVKSLLVRARVSLAEAAEARALTCEEVRGELGRIAEGLEQRMSPPVRRHVRQCERCAGFRKQLRHTNKALAAVFPVGPLLFLKKALLAQLGTTASAGGAAATTAAAGTAASGGIGALSAGVGAVASKTAAGLAAAALVTAGAVEVQHAQGTTPHRHSPAAVAAAPAPPVAPVVVASAPQVATAPAPAAAVDDAKADKAAVDDKKPAKDAAKTAAATTPADATATTTATTTTATPTAPAPGTPGSTSTTTTTATAQPTAPERGSDTSALPPQQPGTAGSGGTPAPDEPAPAPSDQQPTASSGTTTTTSPQPAPSGQTTAPSGQATTAPSGQATTAPSGQTTSTSSAPPPSS